MTPPRRCRSALARQSGGARFASKRAPTGFLGLLFATPVLADLDAATREAHWEWQNRGLGGFRGWCRKQGQAAAQRFLAEP